METKNQPNSGNDNLWRAPKKLFLYIVVPLFAFILGALLAFYFPEKESELIRKNQSGGENQMAIRKISAISAFEKYLDTIERRDTMNMWNQSTYYRRRTFKDLNTMIYDYCLTRNYEVQYIIPIGENYSIIGRSPAIDTVFSFYALLRFEDNVCEEEVSKLKYFHNANIEEMCNPVYFEPLFEGVVEEMYEFVDHRFVIDSAEYVKNEMENYMMNMTMKDYITLDWRFPVIFAKKLKLPLKSQADTMDCVSNHGLGHLMLSRVIMEKEDGDWKLSGWRTVAISRW